LVFPAGSASFGSVACEATESWIVPAFISVVLHRAQPRGAILFGVGNASRRIGRRSLHPPGRTKSRGLIACLGRYAQHRGRWQVSFINAPAQVREFRKVSVVTATRFSGWLRLLYDMRLGVNVRFLAWQKRGCKNRWHRAVMNGSIRLRIHTNISFDGNVALGRNNSRGRLREIIASLAGRSLAACFGFHAALRARSARTGSVTTVRAAPAIIGKRPVRDGLVRFADFGMQCNGGGISVAAMERNGEAANCRVRPGRGRKRAEPDRAMGGACAVPERKDGEAC